MSFVNREPYVLKIPMIVVKVGGGTSLNIDAVVTDIVALRAKGTELLLVHGGAQTTKRWRKRWVIRRSSSRVKPGTSAGERIGERSKSSRWSTAAS